VKAAHPWNHSRENSLPLWLDIANGFLLVPQPNFDDTGLPPFIGHCFRSQAVSSYFPSLQ
jgi:hypothetical protein